MLGLYERANLAKDFQPAARSAPGRVWMDVTAPEFIAA